MVWAVSLDDSKGTAASALSDATGQIHANQLDVSIISQSEYPGCLITDCAST